MPSRRPDRMARRPSRERRPFVVDQPGLHRATPVASCVIVIFGASGDLARRQLLPSLFELYMKRLLPEAFAIIGISSSDWNTEKFCAEVKVPVSEQCAGADRQ